jgi:hypothetical protein
MFVRYSGFYYKLYLFRSLNTARHIDLLNSDMFLSKFWPKVTPDK